ITPGGYFDNVWDKNGKVYQLSDLAVRLNTSGNFINVSSSYTCQSGFFKIYFANGSGMDGNTTLEISRRNTICELCENVSALLGWNGTWPSNGYVKLLVDDINNQTSSPSTSSVLALGTSIYAAPLNPSNTNPGIEQNMMQRTIISQTDGWLNVVNPLNMSGSNGFYHGFLSFNFANPTYTWNSVHTTTILGMIDLYEVALHELTHTLGFTSLISASGISRFGVMNNYYSTYDKFLFNPSGSPLITTSNTCNQQYGYAFSGGTLNLQPGCPSNYTTDVTVCSVACKYNSSNVPNVSVYTPGCFDGGGGTCSHFEDMCYPNNTPTNNNQYFIMSNATNVSVIRRYLKNEERKVLCDLGYSVTTTYTSLATNASHTYSGTYSCAATPVWGINDGFLGSVLIYTSVATAVNIPFSGITNNDAPGVTPTCIETVYNTGTVSVTGTIITFSPAANYAGPFLLRYIPTNTTTNTQGNITYIFGFIYPGICNPVSPCDMVQNGGFESRNGCGLLSGTVNANCWTPFTSSPDLFSRNCTTSNPPAFLGSNTYSSTNSASVSMPFDSHSPSNNNDAVVGLGALLNGTGVQVSESMANFLGSPMLLGQTYQLSFWAYQFSGNKYDPLVSNGGMNQMFNIFNVPAVLNFASSNNFQPTNLNNYPNPMVNSMLTVTLANVYNTWKHYSVQFTYTSTANGNLVYIGTDDVGTSLSYLGSFGSLPPSYLFYTLIDDVSIKPIGQVVNFNLPNTQICSSQGYTNLAQYTSIPGGTFSGVGITTVTSSSGIEYNFNVPAVLTNSLYTITYTYTDALGCTQKVYQQINIGSNLNSALLSYIPATGCTNPSTLSVLSPTASLNFTWQPGNIVSMTTTVSPSSVTIYTASAVAGIGCNITGTVLVQPNITTPTIVPISNINCWSSTLTAVGNFTNITWQPGNLSGSPVLVSPSVATVYTAVATNSNGCVNTITTVVNAVNPSTVSIVNTNSSPCIGGQSTLTANNSLAFNSTLFVTWSPGNATINPIIVTPSVTTTYTANLSNIWGCLATATTQVYVSAPALNITNNNCPNSTAIVTAIGNYTSIIWQPGSATTPSYAANVNSTFVYSATTNYSNGCSSTNTFQVLPLNSPSNYYITGTQPVVCSGNSETLTLISTPSFSNVLWLPGNYTTTSIIVTPTANTTYTALITTSLGCSFQSVKTITVSNNCCTGSLSAIAILSPFTQTISGNYYVNSDIVIPPNCKYTLSGEFLFAPNVKVVVAPSSTLNIESSHLYACKNQMWKGIVIEDGGMAKLFSGSKDNLIEDALIAIDAAEQSTNSISMVLDVANTTFNKNYVGIHFQNCFKTTASYPISVRNSVFTCRNLPFTPSTWPQTSASAPTSTVANLRYATATATAGLAAPYITASSLSTIANLLPPHNSQSSQVGIRLGNVGWSPNPYVVLNNGQYMAGATIGNTKSDFNLFDALHIGIESTNSNLNSYNNVFQNTQVTEGLPGMGISATNNYSVQALYYTRLNMGGHPDTCNYFYDCHTGLNVRNLSVLRMKYSEFKSGQNVNTAPSPTNQGQFGLYVANNQFRSYVIRNNKFLNLQTGAYVAAITGLTKYTPAPAYGQLWGGLSIQLNMFSSAANLSAAQGTGFMGDAVVVETPLFNPGESSASPAFFGASPLTGIAISDNTMDRVWRGINVNGFGDNNFARTSGGNTITLVADPSGAAQWGIAHTNNMFSVINANKITGFGTTLTDDVRGILNSMNKKSGANCNEVITLPRGMEFAGTNLNMVWRQNTMTDNARGLQLTATGLTGGIGQQGSTSNPSDNYWATPSSWVGRFHTWTDANSYPSNSQLYIRQLAAFNPTNNGTAGPFINQIYDYASGTLNQANSTTIIPCYTLNTEGGGGDGTIQAMQIILGDDEDDNIKQVAQYLLFWKLDADTALRFSNDTIQAFYEDNLTEPMGVLSEIEALLAANKLSEANTLLSGFSPNGNIETNYQLFYTIYAGFAATGTISSSNDYNLHILAAQCPYSDGAVVYKARMLYNYIHHQVVAYNDENCVSQGYAGRGTHPAATGANAEFNTALATNEANKPIRKTKPGFKLYPNPANDVLYIKGNFGNGNVKYSITDVNFKTLMAGSANALNGIAVLKLDLISGIYFVNLVTENGYKTVKKLIIAR
ncbi:MAG: T9SS type A sorting domain-containing protein, partial [Bacteroidia bacterium]|nr:T9SS type A sorting domain-containing protein [Bacteroidia bacterium]